MKITKDKFTYHAEKRSQQRGIKKWVIDFISKEGDKFQFCGGAYKLKFISKRKLETLKNCGSITAQQVERLNGVMLILTLTNDVITIFHKTKRIRTN